MKHQKYIDLINETEEPTIITLARKLFGGLLAIFSLLFVIVQIPYFGIDLFSGVTAGYASLAGTITFLLGLVLILHDKPNWKSFFQAVIAISYTFLFIIFIRNWVSEETYNWNILNFLAFLILVYLLYKSVTKEAIEIK